MRNHKLPPRWNEARVQRLIEHYDQMTHEELVAEDEAALEAEGKTVMVVPTELVPAIRDLIARSHAQ